MARHIRLQPQISARSQFHRLFDDKFREKPAQYVKQCLAATIAIFVILSLLNVVTQTVLIASLGASSFISFTMPHVSSAQPRYLIGGYLVGTVCGVSVSLLAPFLLSDWMIGILPNANIALGALATGLAMFIMVITDTEHPPAAALALGFVLNEWDLLAVGVVIGGIFGIVIIKELFKAKMIDLL